MNSAVQFFSQLVKLFNSLTLSKKVSIVVVAVVVLVSLAVFVVSVNQTEYRTLFSNLSTEDAGRIVAKLREKKIPYEVSRAGDVVMVPEGHISELRLEMAVSGLPSGGGMGFEIFDNKNFGVTDFVQQLNYQRALQGELMRTINGLDEVQQSRVHIVIPRQSLFVEEQAKPTASVIIKPRSGKRIRPSQVEGIVSLVSSSVEGLLPEEVMVVDSSGNILSTARARDESPFSRRAASQIEYQRGIEKDLANRIQSMLEKVVGAGKVVAKVSAEVDFSVVEKTEEAYDPEEPVVRSLRRQSEKSTMPSGGESSVAFNEGGRTAASGAGREELNEVINYEINRVVSKTVMPVGELEKLSVAVLVDGVYNKTDAGSEEFQPRPDEEIKTLESLVKKSVGFDAARGDQVAVTSIPFRKLDLEMEPVEGGFWAGLSAAAPFIKYFFSLTALMLVLFFVLRPLIKFVLATGEEGEAGIRRLAALSAEGAAQLEAGEVSMKEEKAAVTELESEGFKAIETVRNLAGQDAHQFAELLKAWLR
jgi:flagellar M-ring protein FliF